MKFPEESIKLAKEIAAKYKERKDNSYDRAKMLYANAFLEFKYGFDEALKSGKVAAYLHEVKSMCDCDSLGGIDYLVANELGLKPQIYSAYGMVQTSIGQNPNKGASSSHTFITVDINKKKYVLDKLYNTFGEVKINGNNMEIRNVGGQYSGKEIRTSERLVKLTVEEYLERFETTRQKGGREALSVGRKVNSLNHKIVLNFKEPNILITFLTASQEKEIIEEKYYNYGISAISAPVEESGKWNTDEGTYISLNSSNSSWDFYDLKDQHIRFDFPLKIVKEYVANLRKIHHSSGKKSKIEKLKIKDYFDHFENLGIRRIDSYPSDKFDEKKTGVNRNRHIELVNILSESIPKSEPENVLPDIISDAAYVSIANKLRCEKNPRGYLYTEEDRRKIEKEYLEKIKENFDQRIDMLMKTILASAGMIPNKKIHEDNLEINLNRENEATRYRDMLNNRKSEFNLYEKSLDFTLFKKNHPLASVMPSEEDMKSYYMQKMQVDMFLAMQNLEALELKGKRKGLEKLLKLK